MKSGWFSTFFSLLLLLHTFCLVTCQKKLKQRQSEKIQNEKEEDDDDEEEVGETTHCGKRNYVNVTLESMTSTTSNSQARDREQRGRYR